MPQAIPVPWIWVNRAGVLYGTLQILLGAGTVLFALRGHPPPFGAAGLAGIALGAAHCGAGIAWSSGRVPRTGPLGLLTLLRYAAVCLCAPLLGLPALLRLAALEVPGLLLLGAHEYRRTQGPLPLEPASPALEALLGGERPPPGSRWGSPLMAILFLLSISWSAGRNYVVPTLIAMLLHEGGHVLAFRWFGYRLRAFRFLPFALAVEAEESFRSSWEEVLIALAGPMTNAALAVGSALAYAVEPHEALRKFAEVNTVLGLLNLLPVAPLDGGRILRGIAFSLPAFFLWAYLGATALLGIAGAVALESVFMGVIFGLGLLAEWRLIRAYFQARREGALPEGDPQGAVQALSAGPHRFHTAALLKMAYAPRLRALEIAALLGLVVLAVLLGALGAAGVHPHLFPGT